MSLNHYKDMFLEHLSQNVKERQPNNLYDPINYILNLGGKRLRPILVLMSCDLFNGKNEEALDAALAIEMFHNFSLVHDDIMDKAPLRRGQSTVHKKWDSNTGILSGDAMLILAYQYFESYKPEIFIKLAKLFSETALEVCEGQQYDMDFETQTDVSLETYLKMITFKTAVLIAAALKMGAIIANVNETDTQNIYDFGLNLGIAFQLQDDYLDVFADVDFGKQKAGDIIENKKTFLYLKTLELASVKDKNELLKLYASTQNTSVKVEKATALFNKYKIPQILQNEIEVFTQKAFKNIETISINDSNKEAFIDFAKSLMHRKI